MHPGHAGHWARRQGSGAEAVELRLEHKPRQKMGYMRAMDVDGNWGTLNAMWLTDPMPDPPAVIADR